MYTLRRHEAVEQPPISSESNRH